MHLVCVTMNWKEISPCHCEVRSVVCFLTIENYSGAKICHLCAAFGEEDVMNLRYEQRWQLMFEDGRTNIQDDKHKEPLSMMLDKTVWCLHTLLEDDHHLTITDMLIFIWSWWSKNLKFASVRECYNCCVLERASWTKRGIFFQWMLNKCNAHTRFIPLFVRYHSLDSN